MIKRNAFSRDCELAAQQEIKNYRDSLNGILQSLRDLREEITSIKNDSYKNYGIVHSQVSELKSHIQTISSSNKNDKELFVRFVNDSESIRKGMDKSIKDAVSIQIENSVRCEFNKTQIDDLKEALSSLSNKIKEYASSFESSQESMKYKIDKDLNRMKEEILSAPSELESVKKELQHTLDIQKIDAEGIMRELVIWKRENHITQKKLENIYTLIERLQKDKSI